MSFSPTSSNKENEQVIEAVGESLNAAIVSNDQQQLLATLSATSKTGLEYLDRFENTPLLVAAYLGRPECVRILLQHGANFKRINVYGQNALSLATHSGNRLTCEELLRVWSYKNFNNRCMLPPLCVAALEGNVDMVRFYMARERELSAIADVKCKTSSLHGVCPLQLAVQQEHDDIIRLLRDQHVAHI